MRNLILTACVLSLSACKVTDGGDTDTAATTGTDTTSVATAGTTGATTTTTATAGTDTTMSLPTTTIEPGTTTVEPGTTTVEPGTTTVEPGTTTVEPGTTTVEPGTTTTGEPGTTTTTGEPGTTTTGEPGTTGEPVDCGALGAVQCANEPACMPIGGAKINLVKMCVAKPMFIECVTAAGCGDAPTNGCDPAVMPPAPFLFNSTCLPTDWMVCEAPMNLAPCK